MISLQHGAYQQSSIYLSEALKLGYENNFELAYSLTMSGDQSALPLLDSLYKNSEYTDERSLVLKNCLENPSLDFAFNSDDPEKFLWLKIWHKALDPEKIRSVLNSFSRPEYQSMSALAVLDKKHISDFSDNNNEIVHLLRNNLKDNKLPVEISDKVRLSLALTHAEIKPRCAEYLNEIRSVSGFDPSERSIYEFLRIWSGQSSLSEEKQKELLQMAVKNPFNVSMISLALSTFEQPNQFTYEAILTAINGNEYSVDLLEEYIIQCAYLNLDSSAEIALERLSKLTGPEKLEEIIMEYRSIQEEIEREFLGI
jgi:hypothetical protein